jgi:Undecaprenyl-phosphate glucose phosphotransferase
MTVLVNSRTSPKAGIPAVWGSIPLSYRSLGLVMIAADFFFLQLASVATGTLYHLASLGSYGDTAVYFGTGLMAGYLFVSALYVWGAYRPSNLVGGKINHTQLLIVWLGVFLSLAGVAFVLRIGAFFSRGAVLSFVVVGCVGLVLLRWGMDTLIKRAFERGLLRGPRVVLIGHVDEVAGVDYGRELGRYGYRVVHRVVRPSGWTDTAARRIVDDVLAVARTQNVDEIVLALHWSELHLIRQIAAGLRRLPLPVRLLPDDVVRQLIHLPSSDLGASVALELQHGPLNAYQRALKRVFDIFAASVGLLAISPMLLMVALIIKFDSPGPVLFSQLRTGYSGRTFRIVKFRTMNVLEDGDVIVQAKKNDDRVTRSGRWLRRTSIDELPQLFNVLWGDMSLVGPRPHALAHDVEYAKLIDRYELRFQVKPGITGWAQVNGFRGETETVDLMASRIDCDLWYISNWSLMLDLRTLIKTLGAQLQAIKAC